jgi:hypothetical protein
MNDLWLKFINLIKFIPMTDLSLYIKISELPADLKPEVSDFIDFLLQKKPKRISNPLIGFLEKLKDLSK